MSVPKPFLSVVIPVYKAEGMIGELVRRIKSSVAPVTGHFEIILVDDREPGNSWAQIQQQAELDSRVKGLRLSRNFGQHKAITAGLDYSRGEWVVVMDCDLQDQPEEIPALLARAKSEPADIVFARRAARQDTVFRRFFSAAFYRVLSYLTDTRQDPAIANFGVYNRKVINAVLSLRESIRYFPAMVRWVGFSSSTVDVVHARRAEGRSSYNFSRRLDLAFDIILAYSDKPLRLTVKLGLLVSAAAFVMVLVTLGRFLAGSIVVLGYTSLIISIWFLSGLLLSVLGMVGLYLGKTFEQVKNRPIYLVDEDTAQPVQL